MHRVNTKKWAEFWGVSVRTVQNWLKDGSPVEKPIAMANLILQNPRPAKKALAKAHELIARHEGLLPDPERVKVGDSIAATTPLMDVGPRILIGDVDAGDTDLRSTAAWLLAKAKACTELDPVDMSGFTYWHERYLKTDKAIRDAELHAKKMGLDEGQIINREEFERLMFAMAFWMMRGVEVDLKDLAPKCVGLEFVEVAYGVLDRFFVRARFFSAFSKSITQESGVSLPLWAYDGLKRAVDTFWETDLEDKDDVAAYDAFLAALRYQTEGGAKSA